MKTIHRLLVSLLFLFVFLAIGHTQNIVLRQSNPSGIYKKGEKVQLSVYLQDTPAASLSLSIRKNDSEKTSLQKIEYLGKELILFDEALYEPTALIFEVSEKDESASIGLVVAPESFNPGTKRPKDIDRYWKKEKRALQALPMEVKAVPVSEIEKGYACSDIEINCTGPKPARGYFAKPLAAKPASLPIVLYVHAAGVKGAWCLSQPENAMRYAKMGKGALSFDLNAHGMLNGQAQAYYDDLEQGELKNYFRKGAENRDDFYFRGMYLRLIRTLDFLTSQPEWDGKRILVIGESQGGGQALVAAGLDKRVTAAVATVPAMCDWGGAFADSRGGWPNPFHTENDKAKMMATLPYFDAAHLLKKSNATLVTEIGLIDRTCPPTSIYAAINQSKGEKIVFAVPYRGHHLNQVTYKDTWENTVYKPKMAFIHDFLNSN